MAERGKFGAAIFRRGLKREVFEDDNGNDDDTDFDGKLNDLYGIWNLTRSGKELGAAIWRPEHAAAEVVLQRGKLLGHMGFGWGRKHFIYIEEAVYLLDRASLLLFAEAGHGKQRLVSLQEAQEIMLENSVPMDLYLVYSKLMRAGYIVHRHDSKWMLKPSEFPMKSWFRCSIRETSQHAAVTSAPEMDKIANPNLTLRWWSPAIFPSEELPRCDVELLNSKQEIRSFHMRPLNQLQHPLAQDNVGLETTIPLHFDVYQANSHFRRKDPGSPIYIVSVVGGDSPPALSTQTCADMISDGIPIRFASIEYGDIAFYALASVQLGKILR